MSDPYTPKPEHKFTFGLWRVGNIGRDPFGGPVREPLTPVEIVHLLADVGAYGVNLHDNDLVPIDATRAERNQIVRNFKQALADTGLVVPMATTNLFSDPAFKDGAFTANDPQVRAYALQKTMQGIDLGVELGAQVYVFWGGREGTETDASKNPLDSLKRFREALNFLCDYVIDQGYDLRFALEAKPNEPRGDIFLPTTGVMLGFIATLDHSEMVGVNPEVAHEHMARFNRRFAIPARESEKAWRKVPAELDLDRLISFRYRSVVGNDNSVRIGGLILDVPPGPNRRSYAKAQVEVRQLLNGSWRVYYQDQVIAKHPSTELREPVRALKHTRHIKGTFPDQWVYWASAPPAQVLSTQGS